MDQVDERREKILNFMKEAVYKPLSFKELVNILEVPQKDIQYFKDILEQLETEGKVFKNHRDRYGIPERMNLTVGKLQSSERGYAFLVPDDKLFPDVFISPKAVNGGMHKDRVIVRINESGNLDKRSEGEVIKILERNNQIIVGTYDSNKYFGFVAPDDQRISQDIFIPKGQVTGAKTGQKVVVEITKWPEKGKNPEGRIIEILGFKNKPGVDILSILKGHNLNEEFPEEVIEEAKNIEATVTAEMIKNRRDLRNLTMVTIDGEDAKDLDDAISLENMGDFYRLGVHIADVTHYVKEGSELDKEALKRATSVYLVDRVIPMLPRELSNGICSLNPKVDRLAFTVIMDIDNDGNLINHEIFESVIHINERMTYTNVFKILEQKDEELLKRYDYLINMFDEMKNLALILRKKRMDRGAIDFDFDEAKIILDELGKPIDVKRYEITIANKIIEEFMLACNETVAEHFFWGNVPFMYRIHETPDPEKMHNFAIFAQNLGHTLKGITKIHPKALQQLLNNVKGTKEENLISRVMLRSLQKAKYSHDNDIHFGLATNYYSHFTSPIRRYPDLIIHRIMKEFSNGSNGGSRDKYWRELLPGMAEHCSERERSAEEAERDTDDVKKAEYMKQHEGEIFDGIISGVSSSGIFVELKNTIEGKVKLSSLEDDFYVYHDTKFCVIGERNRKIYRIGDEVRVIVARVDEEARLVEFLFVDKDDETGEDIIPTIKTLGKQNFKKISNPKPEKIIKKRTSRKSGGKRKSKK